jgi:hypothetical protein
MKSTTLADIILSGFAGPQHVPVIEPKPAKQKSPPSIYAPKGKLLDDKLGEMIAGRQPGESFTQDQIAAYCGVSRRLIQFIEKKAFYKLSRRLLKECPEDVTSFLGLGFKREDILRIHHPHANKSQRRAGEWDQRLRSRVGLKNAPIYGRGLPTLREIGQKLNDRPKSSRYGRGIGKAELLEIRQRRKENNLCAKLS